MTFIHSVRLIGVIGLGAIAVSACGSSDSNTNAQPATSGGGYGGGFGGGTAGAVSVTCNNNNVIDGNEQCDGTNLGGKTCGSVTLGAQSIGNLICQACVIVTSGCTGGGGGGVPNTGGGSSRGGAVGTGGGP